MYRSAYIAKQLLQIKFPHLLAFMVDGYLKTEGGEDYLDFAQREYYRASSCCLKSLCEAYAYVLSNDFRGGDLTIEKLNKIYLLSGDFKFAAEEKYNIDSTKRMPKDMRSKKLPYFAGYGLRMKNNKKMSDNLSKNGLKELIKTIKLKGQELEIALVSAYRFVKKINSIKEHTKRWKEAYACDNAIRHDNINTYKYSEILWKSKNIQYMYMAPHPFKVPGLLSEALDTLNRNLALTNNDNDKIKHIRQFVAAGIKIHPWMNFNLRTFQCFEFGVLMREGILPSVKYVPSRICHYTEKEMIKEYQRDRETTKKLIKNFMNGPKYDNTNRKVGYGRRVTVHQNPDGYNKRHKEIYLAYGTYDEPKIYEKILSPFVAALEKLASQAKEIGYRPRRSNICGCCFPGLKKKGVYIPL